MIICPEYPPNTTGGGGAVYAALAAWLTAMGHEVMVVHGDYTRSLPTKGSDPRIVPIRLLPTPSRLPFLLTVMPPTVGGIIGLWVHLKKFKPDVVHLHGYAIPYIDCAARLVARARVPFIMTVHGFPTTPKRIGGIVARTYNAYTRLFSDSTLSKANAVTAVSRALSKKIKNDYVMVVPNGADVFPPRNQDIGGWHSNVCLAYGRLAFDKGFHLAIEALALLQHEFPDLQLVIAGPDHGAGASLRRQAAQLRDGTVTLMGGVDRSTIQDLMNRAFAVLMPSLDEPFGLAAVEALSAGVPLIASDSGALPDIVANEVDGLLHRPGDSLDLAAKIRRLKQDRKLYRSLCANGPVKASKYSWEKMTLEYLRLYRSIIVE